ncbi:MAG: Gfo/Idh/MocA family oxidoreductase [Eubacteriales bacterium]|nr:Gfo/Idh/MocA family oxidoreductase [Eubacteriales bacterium]
MDKLKAGFIGCGDIAQGKYFPSFKALGGVDMLAFCDTAPAKADIASAQYGAPGAKVFTDYQDLLAMDLDFVIVSTPNRSHSYISVDALKSGKHVMCEKPMAINTLEAGKMLAASREAGKLLTVGYQNRYRSDSQYLKKAAEAGVLGEVYFARANALRRRAVPTWGVFLNENEQGGGPLIDIGTHALDLTLWIMDNYKPRYAVGTTYHKLNKDRNTGNMWGDWNPDAFTVEDSAFGFIVMENGATVTINASWALNTLEVEEATCTLSGTKAGADFHDGLRINGVRHNQQYVETLNKETSSFAILEGRQVKPAVLEIQTFLKAVRGEGKLCVLPEQALTVTHILEGIYESSRSGEPYYFNLKTED